jgi:GTPase SAR1 family protein
MIGSIDSNLKIVLIGDSGTGKSSLLMAYLQN